MNFWSVTTLIGWAITLISLGISHLAFNKLHKAYQDQRDINKVLVRNMGQLMLEQALTADQEALQRLRRTWQLKRVK